MAEKGLAAQQGQMVQFGGMAMTQEQFRVIEHTIAPGLDQNEMELFFYECKRRGVHPLDRLIFPIKRNDNSEGGAGQKKLTFQCSIDYLRAAAEDTGKYLGQDPVVFGDELPLSKACPKTGAGHDDIMVPEFATVTMLRRSVDGDTIKVSATAYWREYYPGEKLGFMWRKSPRGQLAKCAEALAIRKAFPRQLGQLYANEEVERVDTDIPFAKASTVREKPAAASGPSPSSQSKEAPAGEEHGGPQGSLPGVAVEIPAHIKGLSEVKQKLYVEAMTICENDYESAKAFVKKTSEFDGQNGKKHWISLDDMSKTSDAWAGKTLHALRESR